ncbi:hypothetical protein VSDG_04156 [Cytospora chrysosperma]|uniref:U4/U6.U5 small nuclear ribonucleoprotein 27kDa protein domain-containing protein n=1 Tax=Cytospora chrysosperma TaxID=252740 RepID=A0A423W0S8_CYTCH|nr:hypothetical protein VSDG_04156 [Valsa sordida]
MDDMYDEELDADAAAMAEAMGFTGFGTTRNKKRKFNPNADSSVAEEPSVPSFTGANTAPLGQRRRPAMNLPPPASQGGGSNADEIGLDEGSDEGSDDGDGGGGGVAIVGTDDEETDFRTEPQSVGASRPPREGSPEGMAGVEVQARINAIVAGDANPAGTAAGHQEPRYQQPQGARGPRRHGPGANTNAAHAAKAAGLPWWEGAWDPKLIDRMIENPWDRLERQAGLRPRGTWGRRDRGGTAAAGLPVSEELGTRVPGAAGEAVVA